MDSENERAIKLIQVNTIGKYVLSEEGKTFISQIQGPIAVISVAGMYRTGKSYLLNRMLLNRSNGFGVGPTVNPCTKGLWCWNRTIAGKTADGQSINVIIIDTEGIGALDQDQTHDTRIFTLAILAASSFIYNSTGSIDENALQNLSLVVNLTKNMQLNQSKSQDEQDDPQQLAQYFPAFYWVVRDFSLQLINTQGDPITPKQYLERALAPQKGFSDDVEQKNRIRRLLSSFFKQRECLTLVRPLVDEKKLQHLDQLDLEHLRPQFVDQVMNFRRRILGRVKPKIFKGKQLDGLMYLCLLNSYVNAINNGAVPNIENAWNYMCQQKCAKAFEQSLSYFNNQAQKNLKCLFPTEEQFLVEQLKELKQKSCQLFQVNSVGDKTKFHLKQLRQNIQNKIQLLRIQNQRSSENSLKNYFKKSIVQIENKLRLRQYPTFQQFMKQLNQFYNNLLQSGPLLPKKQAVFLALLKKVIPAAADIFLRDKAQDFKNYKIIAQQKQMNLQSSLDYIKKQAKEVQQRNKQKLNKLDRQKIQLQLQLDDLKNTTQQMKKKNISQTEKWQLQLRNNLQNFKKKQQCLNDKIITSNEQINQLNGEIMAMRCQDEKKIALVTLKNQQLHSQLQQIKRKEAHTVLSLRNLQISSNDHLKNASDKYQLKLRQKQIQIKQLKNNVIDLQQQNKSIQQQLNQLKIENQDQSIKLKLALNQKQSELAKSLKQKEQLQKQIRITSQEQIFKLKSQLVKNLEKYNQIEKQLKAQSESYSTKQRSRETQISLLKQQIQFGQIEAKQYKNQLNKSKKQYEEKIACLIQQYSHKENQNNKIQEQVQKYEQKIVQMKYDNDSHIKRLNLEIQELTKQLNQIQLQLKNNKNRFKLQLEEKSNRIKELQQQIEGQDTDSQRKFVYLQQQWKQKEKNYIEKIQKLEYEMEQSKQQILREQRQQHQKSQQIVLQLKNYYEIQKQKLQNKIVFEKQKYQRKIAQLKAEHEQKLRQQTMDLESQYQFLKQKFSQIEEQLVKEKTNRKIEVDIKNKQIENLQKTVQQMKSKIDNKEVELLNKIDRLQKQHSAEKETLHLKIQQFLTKQSKLQKERSVLSHNKQQLQKLLQHKEKTVEQLKQQLVMIKQKNQADKQNDKTALNSLNTKLMQERVQFEKKTALLRQENDYLKIKIQENEKYQSTHQTNQDDRFKKLKQQYSIQLKASREKFQADIDALETKYQKTKKSSKQKQASMQKTVSQLQKSLAIYNQKNDNLTQKLKIYEEKQLSENEQYNISLTNLKISLNKQKQVLKEQLENQQKQKEKIQAEKIALIADFQKQKLLLENRNKFLEEGKERYRQDYEDTKSKLQLAIQNSRKRWNQQKTSSELAHSQYMAKIEKKYWQQKQQISQNMKKLQMEYENKMKSLQAENRMLHEKLSTQQQNKMGTQNISDRRLREMTENEKRLQIELDRLKNTRQNQQLESQNQQKQKQNLKMKLKQKEQKYRAMQKQKQHLFYQMQKEKAKWKMQKDGILNKTEQQKQLIQKFQREIEKLQRQNQKLKVERKCQKTSMQSMTRYSSNFSIDRGFSRSSLEQSILKQNSNNNSQISDNSIFFKE